MWIINDCKYITSSTFRAWLILTLLALIGTNINLQFPCLMTIKKDLDTSHFIIQLSLILGPGLAIISNVVISILTNYYSNKTLLTFCIILFLTGSLTCYISPNIGLFLRGRILQVLGDSGLTVVAFALLADLLNGIQLGQYLGYNTILTTIFAIFAPLLGSFILNNYGWRINFLLLGVLSFCLLSLYYFSFANIDNKQLAKSTSSPEIPIISLFDQYIKCLKKPIFTLAVLSAAFHSTIATLLDFYSPFFYIDVHSFTHRGFAYIKAAQVLISVMASFTYVWTLKRHGLKYSFEIGKIFYLFFITNIVAIVLTSYYDQPYIFFLILSAIHSISIDFLHPICMFIVISYFRNQKVVVLTIFALMRNIISTLVTLSAAFVFNNTINSVLIIIIIVALPLYYMLSLMKKHL